MYKHRFKWLGGLGDIIMGSSAEETELLQELEPGERAEIFLGTHNPNAVQLFDFHPKRAQIDIKRTGWHPFHEEAEVRKKLEVAPPWPQPFAVDMRTHYYESDEDKKVLAELPNIPFYVIAAGAGERFRNIPIEIISQITDSLARQGIACVMIGASYDRGRDYKPSNNLRFEPTLEKTNVINLIDRLTVPGAMKLMRMSKGVICCHSGMYMYLRNIRKPFALLYPDHVQTYSINQRDHYSVGFDENNTYFSTFANFNLFQFDEFVKRSYNLVDMELVPYPYEECKKYNVPRQTRLTPNQDVRFLCHLFSKCDGAFLDIGCHAGLTTRDIARNFKDRLVYAFDDTAINPYCPKEQFSFCNGFTTCHHAGYLPNVHFIGHDTNQLRELKNVDLAFIDGSASYQGVKQNTDRVLALNPKIVVWHDYFESHNVPWLGVSDYLNTLNYPFNRLEESSLVYAQLRD